MNGAPRAIQHGHEYLLPRAFLWTLRVALLSALSSGVACEERSYGTGGGSVGTETGAGSQKPKATSSPPEAKEDAASDTPAKTRPVVSEIVQTEQGATAYEGLTETWGLSQLQDIGPAGPITATADGVVFVTRDDQVIIAKRKADGSFKSLDLPPENLEKYGRGPAVSGTHAYWISERGKLLRYNLRTKVVEELFNKARFGTRTQVVTASGRDIVTFVAQIGKEPVAYVFGSHPSGKHELLQLSPDGAGASSVALVEGKPHPRAIVLSGRLGMSPVHVRRIRVTKKRLTLENDVVVWIAPGSHTLTEIHGILESGDRAVAFLPTAKDFNDFGLAQLTIAPEPGEIPAPDWQIYKNGLDPAPVDTAKICGKPHVLYARPTEARPRSPQELHLAPIVGSLPKEGEIIARSRAYSEVSMAPTKTGAVVAWTADRRTWAQVLTCPKQK